MKKFLQTGAVFVFVVLLAGQALAESIGQVTAVIPGAYAVRGGQDVPLTVKSAIESGDSLRTDASGKVQIIFADNTTVTLGNNTVMDMQEFAMNEGDSAFKAHLGQGIMRTITGAIVEQNPKGFSVTTPEATIGIRGTDYSALLSDASLAVTTFGGLVEVCNDGGCVLVEPGQTATVSDRAKAPVVQGKGSSVDGTAGVIPELPKPEVLDVPMPGAGSGRETPQLQRPTGLGSETGRVPTTGVDANGSVR